MQNFNIGILAILFVSVALIWLYSRKKRAAALQTKQNECSSSPILGELNDLPDAGDEGIIAVRKMNISSDMEVDHFEEEMEVESCNPVANNIKNCSSSQNTIDRRENAYPIDEHAPILILYVMAKEKAIFSGYELLQVLLGVGLRFGSMNIFHYYREKADDKEETLFSLASATEPGVFDIRNMSAFSCLGLTLFMKKSGDAKEDRERYDLMLQTASHLTEDLDGMLLDANKNLLFQPKSSHYVSQSNTATDSNKVF